MGNKHAKPKNKFKNGDAVVLLSMVSSTPKKQTSIFYITGYNIESGLYYASTREAIDKNDVISVMRPESCFIPAKQVCYVGPSGLYPGDLDLWTDSVLTVRSETEDSYFCFESGIYPIPKSLCKEIKL